MNIIFITLISSVIAAVAGVIVSKAIDIHDPDLKKTFSGFKKTLLFILRYLIPIANLVYLCGWYKEVDKVFVMLVAFVFSVFVFNVSADLISKLIDKVILNEKGLNASIQAAMKISVANADLSDKIAQIIEGHNGLKSNQLNRNNKDEF